MTDKLEGILDIDDDDEVEGHAAPAKYSSDVTASTSFRRIRGSATTTEEDEDDVEGHYHRHHRR